MMNLPEELHIKIFQRVPARSLLICKCVCKTFRSIIQNPDFANTHFTRHRSIITADTSQSLIFQPGAPNHNSCFRVSIDDTTNDVISFSQFKPQIPYAGNLHMIGSCHGLICFSVGVGFDFGVYGNNFLLWNPVTRQTRYLPKPQNEQNYPCIMEFCFNPETKDYIVLRIGSASGSNRILVDMYKMSIDSWTIIDCNSFVGYDFISVFDLFQRGTSVFVEGSVHWGVETGNIPNYIVSFNLKDEELGLIETVNPTKVTFEFWIAFEFWDLVTIEDNLAVLFMNLRNKFQLWVMNDYGVQDSWELMFQSSITFVGHPVACWKYTLIISHQNALYLYDINTKNRKKLSESDGRDEMCFYSFLDTMAPVRILL